MHYDCRRADCDKCFQSGCLEQTKLFRHYSPARVYTCIARSISSNGRAWRGADLSDTRKVPYAAPSHFVVMVSALDNGGRFNTTYNATGTMHNITYKAVLKHFDFTSFASKWFINREGKVCFNPHRFVAWPLALIARQKPRHRWHGLTTSRIYTLNTLKTPLTN